MATAYHLFEIIIINWYHQRLLTTFGMCDSFFKLDWLKMHKQHVPCYYRESDEIAVKYTTREVLCTNRAYAASCLLGKRFTPHSALFAPQHDWALINIHDTNQMNALVKNCCDIPFTSEVLKMKIDGNRI